LTGRATGSRQAPTPLRAEEEPGPMSDYEASTAMPAMAEQVFDEACDLRHAYRWLPNDLRVDVSDRPTVRVKGGGSTVPAEADVRVRRDDLRLEWKLTGGCK
jgi:hypothetical protein